jgi:hypothetical protein
LRRFGLIELREGEGGAARLRLPMRKSSVIRFFHSGRGEPGAWASPLIFMRAALACADRAHDLLE